MATSHCALSLFFLATLLGVTNADYTCLCSYLVETNIYDRPDKSANVIGYMYEFDCKPVYPADKPDQGFEAIGNEHQLGYVEKNSQIQVQTCQGDIPIMDRVTTTQAPVTTATTTTTVATTTTTKATKPPKTTHGHTTHEHTSKVHTNHHTSPIVSSTAVPTTQGPTETTPVPFTTPRPTTITTTQRPTTITPRPTTMTTTPMSTTTTTTPRPITTTTTPRPTTRTTTPQPTTRTSTQRSTTPTTTQPPTTGPYSGCPQSVDSSNSLSSTQYCYELIRHPLSWHDAKNTCSHSGGTLVTLETQQQQTFIYHMLEKVGFYDPIWIGLSDESGEEQWEWVTGNKLSSGYHNWMNGRYIDNYHDQEDCAVFVYTRGGEWDDTFCSGIIFDEYKSFPYICQYRRTFG